MRRSTVYASVAGVLTCSVALGGFIALSDLDAPTELDAPAETELGGARPVRPSVDDPRAAPPPDEGGMDHLREQRDRREMRAALPLPTTSPTPAPTRSPETARPGVTGPGAGAPPVVAAPAPEPTEPPRRDRVAPGPPPADDQPRVVRMRTIEYLGARFAVPAHWPVYRLDEDPGRCVRFDEHAVYLGVPAEDQHCPGAAIGRTEALHVRPYDAEQYEDAPVRDRMRTGRKARVPDTVAREVHARGEGLLFLATFDEHRELIERILRSVRPKRPAAAPGPSATPTITPTRAPSATPTLLPTATPTMTPTTTPTTTPTASPTTSPTTSPSRKPTTSPTTSPSSSPSASATPTISPSASPSPDPSPSPSAPPAPGDERPDKPKEKPKKPKKPKKKPKKKPVAVKLNGRGFDTCAAPSLRAMRAWRGEFDAANIYIGGAARACGYGNLSKSWVRKVKKMGWHLIPTYVGFQAPCAPFRTRMTASRAAAQGKASADDAIDRAKHFGMPKGVPIYFDMEAYDSSNDRCRRAVLLFLDAWSERLKDRGYTSGVYSSAAAAARDLGRSVGIRLPDSIWFAQWDGRSSVWDTPYLSDKWWAKKQRIKQYRGPHREKHGGITLTIDSNRVYGHVW